MGKAVYVVEYRSISHGIAALDKMLKRASLVLLHANPICIGKYLICVGGDVQDALEAQAAAEEPDGGTPFASFLLTGAHPSILAYFDGGVPKTHTPPEAICMFETRNASSGFLSLDAALKSADVQLLRLWLGQFIGGKFCYVLGGGVSAVKSAVAAAAAAIPAKDKVDSRVIPSPDAATMALFVKPEQR